MAPVQISGHAGTFPNSIFILSEELSRKRFACERMNIDKKRIRKYLAIWLDGINANKLIRKIHSVLFAFNEFIMFLPHLLSFFFCFMSLHLACSIDLFLIHSHSSVAIYPLFHFTYALTLLSLLSLSLSFSFFLCLSPPRLFLYFLLSWRPFSVLWPLGFKWSPSAACLSS